MKQFANTFMRYEPLVLLLILGPLLYPNGPQGFLLLVLPLLWLVRWVGTGHFVPPTPLDATLLLLLLMVGISIIAVFDPQLSFPKIVGVLLGVALFYGSVSLMRRSRYGSWYLLLFFVLAGAGMGMIGLIGTNWVGPFAALNQIKTAVPPFLQAIPGTIDGSVNPNELAGVLGWLIPLLAVLLIGLWSSWSYPLRMLVILLISIFGLLLIATLSRGGIIACGVSLLLVFAIGHRWGKWLLLTTLIAAILFIGTYGLTFLFDGANADDPLAINGRLEIWSRAIYGITDFPFTGMSMNGFRRVVHILYPLFLISPTTDLGHAHNHLLQAGLDLGLPGLIAYLSLWSITTMLLWQSWRTATEPTTRFFALGLLGSLAAGWLFGVFDAIALGARPGFMWWLLLAMAVSVYDAARHNKRFLATLSVAS